MDSQPPPASSPISLAEGSPLSQEKLNRESDEPFSMNGTSIAIMGLLIAIATFGAPITAVITDRPVEGSHVVPTALELDEFTNPRTISLSRPGEPSR